MAEDFPLAEYEERTRRLQDGMAGQGLDALLLTTPADVFYVTGFLTRFWESPARPWFVVVPAHGKPLAVIPSIGAELMQRTWIQDMRTWDAPNPQDGGVDLLGEALREVSGQRGAIGVPMGIETHLRMPLADWLALTEAVSPRRIVDATECVQRVREVKSNAEIARIRTTCEIAGRAFDRVPEFARRGRGLDAVFRDFQVACLQAGADWVSYVAGAAGPGGYDDVISPASARALENGDVLMLDTGAVRDGYFCDFDRNYAIGQAGDDVRQAHAALWHATEEVLEAIRPGQRACDVHRMLCDALSRKGAVAGPGRLGHGLGVSLTEWPSFTPMDETVLRAGMVLTLEPGVSLGSGRSLVHEENIVLRDNGATLLSPRATEKLPVVP